MTKAGLVRNLDQIQEQEPGPRGVALGKLLVVSLGGACLAFAALSISRRHAPAAAPAPDPLGALVAKADSPEATKHTELAGGDVTFPGMLSDEARPTTALAAMHDDKPPVAPPALPAPADRLPVVPLPAKNVVSASSIVTRPRDALTQMAHEASAPSAAPVEEGHSGYYQLQASSFRTDEEASSFATALRQRGHRAYVEAAQIPGRGTWYRVRIGPFKTQHEAAVYRAEFERKERIAPFLVEPPRERGPGAAARRADSDATASADKLPVEGIRLTRRKRATSVN